MYITPEVLYDFTQKFVEKKANAERSIIAAYLRGSLVFGSPLLGGTGDIDLVFIHSAPPEIDREIERLTPEIHYDIEHHDQLMYKDMRQLRVHPWLGHSLYDAKPLYDPQHFLDYIQAGVRGQFYRPDYVLQRAKAGLEDARQFWMDQQLSDIPAGPDEIEGYLTAVEQAVNGINLLTGPALPTRRLGMDFAKRAKAVKHPKLYQGFLALLGGSSKSSEALRKWIPLWAESLDALPEDKCPVNLHPHRRGYYKQCLEALLESDQPESMLWPLLKTWTQAATVLPAGHFAVRSWEQACDGLGLCGEDFSDRLRALDAYLDGVADVLNSWGIEQGAG
ncbi:MAG: hypothetical protein B6I38_11465 [Anaerolineaceae bacterium 4572_5.1]|nr:MAG: hypothetical protein B6I38_11465 [Anaerolineaceae bacterium 4572_5.1]